MATDNGNHKCSNAITEQHENAEMYNKVTWHHGTKAIVAEETGNHKQIGRPYTLTQFQHSWVIIINKPTNK